MLAAQKIGIDNVVESIVRSDVTWVVIASALMALSLFFRAASWYWIVRAALPNRPVRRRDVTSATMIGVLMSATLPARLGEPARVLSLSRRTGRMRETFPVLVGTLASQTLLNIVALVLLGVIIVSTTPLFHDSTKEIFAFSFVPLVVLIVLLVAPMLTRRSGSGRLARLGIERCTVRSSRCGVAWRSSAIRAGASPPPPHSSPPGRSSSPPAGRCSPLSASTPRRGSAPPPRFCSPSTSPPWCR